MIVYIRIVRIMTEKRRLRVFGNRMLGRIFGPKRDEVTWEWRKLNKEELTELYSIPNIIRVIKSRMGKCAGHLAHIGERRGKYRDLVGKPEGNRPLGRPGLRWEDNIKMDLHEMGCWSMDWIYVTQDSDNLRARVKAVMILRVPLNAGNF